MIPNYIQTNSLFAKKKNKKTAQNISKKIKTKQANISPNTQITNKIIIVGALATYKGAPKIV